MRSLICLMLLVMLHYGIAVSAAVYGQPSSSSQELTLVVMDPLCDRLACDCVEGYAQRKYEILGEFLQQRLGRKVSVFWGESVGAALEEEPPENCRYRHWQTLRGQQRGPSQGMDHATTCSTDRRRWFGDADRLDCRSQERSSHPNRRSERLPDFLWSRRLR